jgi:hypothetical protein
VYLLALACGAHAGAPARLTELKGTRLPISTLEHNPRMC